ncbi:MAG: universal stress protein [Chromatiales bacterium]|jgi:nucleotide-binding universal stress UspA family protein
MQRFSKILFVNDPAANVKPALNRALKLAQSNEAELTIASFIEEFPRSLSQLQKVFRQHQEEELQSLLQELPIAGVNVNTRLLSGRPFLSIIREVVQQGHELVIKSAEGRGGVSSFLFGSTDLHLLRKCPCPLWIIKPSSSEKFSRILAAVDPDPSEAANAELNKLILDLSSSLVVQESSQLHIVHVWSLPYEHTLRGGRARLSLAEIDWMVRETRTRHKQWFDSLLEKYELQANSVKTHFLKGDPGDVIPRLARQEKVDLIVMGTIARIGIPGFFIGNTAEKTLVKVDCSVLAVKPKSFSTPVQI